MNPQEIGAPEVRFQIGQAEIHQIFLVCRKYGDVIVGSLCALQRIQWYGDDAIAVADKNPGEHTHGRNRTSSRSSSLVVRIRRHTLVRPSRSAHTETMPGVESQPQTHSSSRTNTITKSHCAIITAL